MNSQKKTTTVAFELSRCGEFLSRSAALLLLALSVAVPSAQAAVDTLRVTGNTDRVVIPNAPGLNPSGAVTIEAWVRPTTNAGCLTIVGNNVSQSDTDGDGLGDICDTLIMGPIVVTVQGDLALDIDWEPVPGAIGYSVY